MSPESMRARPTRLRRALRLALLPVAVALAGSLACRGSAPGSPQATAAPAQTQLPPPTSRATPTPAAQATPQAPGEGLAGAWETNWGRLTLRASGDQVSGTYGDGGRIEGTLSAGGRSMEGTWSEPPTYQPPEHAGRVVFALSDDGDSLSGHWWYGDDEEGGEWTGTRGTVEVPVEETPATGAPAGPGLALSSDPENDLLFSTTAEDGGRVYYYGTESGGTMCLTHIIVDDGSGQQDVVIYDGRALPVQWILSTMTVAVYPAPDDEEDTQPDDGWFDPQQAFHVVVDDESERTLRADIRPGDLNALVDEMEAAAGRRFEGARGFLARHDVTFEELAALARRPGPDQPLYIAAAAGFGGAAAALRLEEAGAMAHAGARTAGLAAPQAVIFGEVIKIGAGALGGVLADVLGERLDPGDGPSVSVLLCRGAAKYGMCHYMFYRANRLGACITNCQTSLRCFTDICMPMDISAQLAMSLGEAMGGR